MDDSLLIQEDSDLSPISLGRQFLDAGNYVSLRKFSFFGEPAIYPSQISAVSGRRGEICSIEDTIFNIFKNDQSKVQLDKFLPAIFQVGIRKHDPRLREFFKQLRQIQQLQHRSHEPIEALELDREEFAECITGNVVIINRILRNKMIIPDWRDFCDHIEQIYHSCRLNTNGQIPTYIPQLARMNPNAWAVSVCTVDGQRFSMGEASTLVCLQSVSKALNYALALEELGAQTFHQYVGQEPSGRMSNELCLDYNNKPHNPMMNAGAIITCSLLKPESRPADRYDFILNFYKRMGGGEHIGFNNAVFVSEKEAADRNYALAYYLREYKCFPDRADLRETLDLYFQLCSVEISCETGAVMAATLANGGICPTTDDNVISASCVRDVLSLMYSCGMYDYSGQFAFTIGLPAKSGVSGMILLVVPNVMGICLWSPALDRWSNSVRGVQFCQELIDRFNFHNYDNMKRTNMKLDPRRRRYETKGQQVVNLLFSAANGDVTAMRRYLMQGANLQMADYDKRAALHLAAAEGHEDCVRFLLEKAGVDPAPTDRWDHTPAEEARQNGHYAIANIIESWIDANSRNSTEEQFLSTANDLNDRVAG